MENSKHSNESNQEIDFSYLLKIISNKKYYLVAIFGVITFLSFLYNLNKKPTYQGSFEIVIKDNNKENISDLSLSSLLNKNRESNDTQKIILSSPSVLLPVFESVKEYKNKKNISTEDFYFEDWLSNEIKIDFKKDTTVLEVSALNKDKELILYTLNNISSKYQEYSKNINIQNIKKTIEFLEEEIDILGKKAKKSQEEFIKFSIENGLGTYDGLFKVNNRNRISPLSIISGNKLDNSIFEQSPDQDKTIETNPRFQSQFDLLEEYESTYADLSAKLKPNSKELKVLKNKIDNLKKYLDRPTKILIQFGILKEKTSRDTALLYSTENALALSKITLNNSPNPWEIISTPTIKKEIVSPKIIKNVALSGAFSLFLGIICSYLLYKKQGIVFFEEEIRRNSNFNFLENLYENDKKLNNKIINGILNEKKCIDQKILLVHICRNFNLSDNLQKILNTRNNISFTSLSKLEKNDKSSKIIILLEKGFINVNELAYIEKYVNQFKDNILGLCLVQQSNVLNNTSFLRMKNILDS